MGLMNAAQASKVSKGTRFHSDYQDGRPEWEVTKSLGRAVWEAKCLGPDYAGLTKAFKTEDIQRALSMSQFFSKNQGDHASFYAGLTLGATVHYHNGFGQYVRCTVVMSTTAHDKTPHKCLKPVALVGNWRPLDLPRRRQNGSIDYGYQGKRILEGECMEPNFTSIFEGGNSSARQGGDPTKLPALDLSVPEMDAKQAAAAQLWQAVQAARAALDSEELDPFKRLAAAQAVIEGVLGKDGGGL
jgi:hypothetical protein